MNINDKILISSDEICKYSYGQITKVSSSAIVVKCDDTKRFTLNSNVDLIVFSKIKGESSHRAKISSVIYKTIILTDIKPLEVVQKRMETRVDLDIPLHVTKIYKGYENPVNLNKILYTRLVNLSASGVLLYSTLDIPKYIQLHLEIPLDHETITCLAKIVRTEEKDNGFYYGCKLIMLNEFQKTKIRGFVYKTQIQGRNKNLYSSKNCI